MASQDTILDTLYGPLSVPDWPGDLIVRSLRQLGEWCAAETMLASALLEPGETLYDAGAFLGTFSLGIAMSGAPAHVVAIEANAALVTALTHNLGLLPGTATLVSCGLAQRSGWLVPDTEDPQNHGATAYHFSAEQSGDAATIPTQTLSQLRKSHGDYDFLKLDLEGMELDALRGDFPYLKERKPVIWAECNESPDSLRLLSALKWMNYDVLYVAFPAFRTANFRGATDLIYPMAYEAALVAGPADRLQRLAESAATRVPGEDIICRPITTAFDLRRALFDTPRWTRKEWTLLSRAELIARLGRMTADTRLAAFLNVGASPQK